MVEIAAWVERPATAVGQALSFAEIELAPPHSRFRPLLILDVDAGSIPFDDFPALVSQWHLATCHPAVFPVRPPYAGFVLEDFTARQAGTPLVNNACDVIGMNGGRPFPPLELIHGDTNIFQPALIEVIKVPIGPRAVDQRWDRVDEKLKLGGLEFFLWGGHRDHLITSAEKRSPSRSHVIGVISAASINLGFKGIVNPTS